MERLVDGWMMNNAEQVVHIAIESTENATSLLKVQLFNISIPIGGE